VEDRINKLETITKRLMRRAQKTTVAMITPYPISNAVFGDKVEGSILRYMFPCDGIISKGMFRLGMKPKKEVYGVAKLFNDAETHSKGFTITKKFLSADLEIEVKSGDCLDISINSPDEALTEVWVAFLWKPTTSDIEAKSFLIDKLEELKDDIQKESLTSESALSGDK
jgi:hypothetical protein